MRIRIQDFQYSDPDPSLDPEFKTFADPDFKKCGSGSMDSKIADPIRIQIRNPGCLDEFSVFLGSAEQSRCCEERRGQLPGWQLPAHIYICSVADPDPPGSEIFV